MDEGKSFGPHVSERQLDIVEGYVEKGIADGARPVCGGKRLDRPGFFLPPTVFADVTSDMTIARGEIFCPAMAVLDFGSKDEIIARNNDDIVPLTRHGLNLTPISDRALV